MNQLLQTLVVLVGLSATAHALPGPQPLPPVGSRGSIIRDVTINGIPLLALTSPDDAILNGEPGNRWQVDNDVRTRAQQICSYFSNAQLVNYRLAKTSSYRYVTFESGWSVNYVSEDLVRPFRGQYATGYARGFDSISCR